MKQIHAYIKSNNLKIGLFLVSIILFFSACKVSKNQRLNNEKSYLALGDSYTIGESVAPEYCFPNQLQVALEKKGMMYQPPKIIARTGWRTDELIDAIEANDLSARYDLVTLLIGVNNEFQGRTVVEFEQDFKVLCDNAIHLAGGKKESVIVLTIPDYGFTPYGKKNQAKISSRIDDYNNVVTKIANSKGVQIVDVTQISRKALQTTSLIANDGLHPSAKMYAEWVDLIVAKIID